MSSASDAVVVVATTLRELAADSSVRARAFRRPNFWDVVQYGDASYENRYNRMVRWLLDPRGDHGLGTAVANALLRAVGSSAAVSEGATASVETPTADGQRIDVTVRDDEHAEGRTYIAIECKLDSGQHSDQLTAYRSDVQHRLAPGSWNRVFVFLTQHDDEPDDEPDPTFPGEEWHRVSFAAFGQILSAALADHDVDPDARPIIEHFVRDIARRSDRQADRAAGDRIRSLVSPSSAAAGTFLAASLEAGVVDADDPRARGTERRIRAAHRDMPEAAYAGLIDAFVRVGGDGDELGPILRYCWSALPGLNDASRYSWEGKGSFTKYDLLHLIGRRFIDDAHIETRADFEREFGRVILQTTGASVLGGVVFAPEFLLDPIRADADVDTPSAKRYAARDRAFVDASPATAAIDFGDGRCYRVGWWLGFRNLRGVGVLLQVPLIDHFADDRSYPISPLP